MHKLSLLPIDAEVGYGPAHGHQLIARESQTLWSMVQMLWPDATVDMQHAILRKIQCAGAETVPDLCKLITEEIHGYEASEEDENTRDPSTVADK